MKMKLFLLGMVLSSSLYGMRGERVLTADETRKFDAIVASARSGEDVYSRVSQFISELAANGKTGRGQPESVQKLVDYKARMDTADQLRRDAIAKLTQ